MSRLVIGAMSGAVMGFALGFLWPQPAPIGYGVYFVDAAGEVWVFDSGLTLEDCARAIREDYPTELGLNCAAG